MSKTGNVFIDNCFTVATFLPLLPVLLILLKKTYLNEQMSFLMIICLLNFLGGGLRQMDLLNTAGQSVINNTTALLEMIFLVLLFRQGLGPGVRTAVNGGMIAYLSAIVTYFSIQGWGNSNVLVDSIEALIIGGVILLSLPPLIRRQHVYILQSPQLWIAGGTLFYFFTLILLEWLGGSCFLPVHPPDTEKMAMLAIASVIRYLLYTGAILVA